MKKRFIFLLSAITLFFFQPMHARAAEMLIPVGKVVGLELYNDTVTVAAFETVSTARDAGIREGDCLLSIDGREVTCIQDVREALEKSNGTVRITVRRGNAVDAIKVAPTITREGPRLGIYLRQGITGIGTVTYYDPESNTFGVLGHGVNDPDGQLLKLSGGSIYSARIMSVRKGESGHPGQLMGTLTAREPLGELTQNTPQGVFGKALQPLPTPALPAEISHEVKTGSAVILSTIEGDTPREYSVEILKIYPAARENGRNMLIHITDPALLESTGGIVQGMSGSPIIQDGKLVGAVTHVLVNDPQTGYGIFIENMLEAAG